MPFAVAAQNAAVNAATALITHLALLDATLAEIAGGSPAYARKAITWGGAAAGLDDNTGAIVFDVQSGDSVYFVGFENNISTGTGSTRGWWPAGAQPLQVGVVAASTDLVTSFAHGFSTDQRVVFMDIAGAGLPTGLTEGVVYYVLASGLTADVFKVSTSSAGAAVNITADGECFFARCIPEVFGAQGLYTIADGACDLAAVLI